MAKHFLPYSNILRRLLNYIYRDFCLKDLQFCHANPRDWQSLLHDRVNIVEKGKLNCLIIKYVIYFI